MRNQVSFWIGFFSAALVVVAFAVGAWSVVTEKALNFVAVIFGMVIALTLALFIGLTFRRFILKKILGATEKSLDEISSDTFALISSASRGEKEEASLRASSLTRSVIGWYIWNNFYRWVIGTNVTLLVAFAGFAGTVLFFEQNKKIDEQTTQIKLQNGLLGIEFLTTLRGLLVRPAAPIPLDQGEFVFQVGNESQCDVSLRRKWPALQAVNFAGISYAERLYQQPSMQTSIVDALQALLSDDSGAVSLAALLALEKLRIAPTLGQLSVSRASIVGDIEISSRIKLTISGSRLQGFHCDECELFVLGSLVDDINAPIVEQYGNADIEQMFLGVPPTETCEQAKPLCSSNVFFECSFP